MGTIADDLAALLGGMLKVAEGAAEVEQAADRGLARAAAVAGHLARRETHDRIVEAGLGALFRGVLEEAEAASSPSPSSPSRSCPSPPSARKHAR